MAPDSTKIPEVSFTLRHPTYSYFQLSIKSLPPSSTTQRPPEPLDEITARTYLNAALQQYLGLTGSAIPIDILKVEGQSIWIRLPYDDGSATAAAISQWSSASKGLSLKIEGRGTWLGGLLTKGSQSERLWSLET